MQIAIDALSVTNKSGTGSYTYKLVEHLLRFDDENEYLIFWPDDAPPPEFVHKHNVKVLYGAARTNLNRVGYEQVKLPAIIRREKPDVVHFPASISAVLPLVSTMGGARTVVTVHDLAFAADARFTTFGKRCYYRATMYRSARRCDMVITDSECAKRDIVKLVGIPEDGVVVVPLGVDAQFAPVEDAAELESALSRYGVRRPYLLYVGTIEPRKNVQRIIEAFDSVADRIPHTLVIAGREGWKTGNIFRAANRARHSDRILFAGRIDSSDLAAVYAGAAAFIWPSLYEGFGLPPLEAMACGTPVVTSNTSSLPEVVGDAALKVNPESASEIADAVVRCVEDAELRVELIRLGKERADSLTWQATARATLEVYKRLVES